MNFSIPRPRTLAPKSLAPLATAFLLFPVLASAELDPCKFPFEQHCLDANKSGASKAILDRSGKELRAEYSKVLPELRGGYPTLTHLYLEFMESKGFPKVSLTAAQHSDFEAELTAQYTGALNPAYTPGYKSPVNYLPPILKGATPSPLDDAAALALAPELEAAEREVYRFASVPAMMSEFEGFCWNTFQFVSPMASPSPATSQASPYSASLAAACTQQAVSDLKYEVIEDFATQGSPAYDAAAGASLRKRVLELLLEYKKQDYAISPKARFSWRVQSAASKLNSAKALLEQDFKLYLTRSKPVVRALESRFFNPTSYANLEALFDAQKARILEIFDDEILPRAGLPASEGAELRGQLAALKLVRYQPKPESSFAKKPGLPHPVLEPAADSVTAMVDPFAGSRFETFESFNAFYMPQLKFGGALIQEGVRFLPALLLEAERSVVPLRFVLAHEIGHKIDPNSDSRNGIALSPAYDKLNECLWQTAHVAGNQDGEAFSDWISARVNGEYVSGLGDPSQIQSELDQFLVNFCYDAGSIYNLETLNVHPATNVRRIYLYGRDPLMRKAMGCKQVSHCTMEGLTQ